MIRAEVHILWRLIRIFLKRQTYRHNCLELVDRLAGQILAEADIVVALHLDNLERRLDSLPLVDMAAFHLGIVADHRLGLKLAVNKIKTANWKVISQSVYEWTSSTTKKNTEKPLEDFR